MRRNLQNEAESSELGEIFRMRRNLQNEAESIVFQMFSSLISFMGVTFRWSHLPLQNA
jgi:hypothetical protein